MCMEGERREVLSLSVLALLKEKPGKLSLRNRCSCRAAPLPPGSHCKHYLMHQMAAYCYRVRNPMLQHGCAELCLPVSYDCASTITLPCVRWFMTSQCSSWQCCSWGAPSDRGAGWTAPLMV